MKRVVVFILSLTLLTNLCFGFFKDPRDEIIILRNHRGTFPVKLGSLSFKESNEGPMVAYQPGTAMRGIISDASSLEIVHKYLENPDYHLDNAKKLGFYVGGPLVVLGFYFWRKNREEKEQTKLAKVESITPNSLPSEREPVLKRKKPIHNSESTDREKPPKSKLYSDSEHAEAVKKMRQALDL